MLLPLREQQASTTDLTDESVQNLGLDKRVAVRLQNLFVGFQGVNEQRFFIAQP